MDELTKYFDKPIPTTEEEIFKEIEDWPRVYKLWRAGRIRHYARVAGISTKELRKQLADTYRAVRKGRI